MNSYHFGEQEYFPPTAADLVRDEVTWLGSRNPAKAWLLSNYDTWERNPYYDGPEVPHPEADDEPGEEC